jgi:hypothetical protein
MIEEMLMMRPVPRSIMCSSAARDMKKAPERLTARTLYQSSSVILKIVLSEVMPALLTRMSRRPWWSMTSCTVRRQSSAELTLPWWMETGISSLESSAWKASARSRSRP